MLDSLQNTLTITFDQDLDSTSTVLSSQLKYGDGTEMYTCFGAVTVLGTTVKASIFTPPGLPFGSGAWYFNGAGQITGDNGLDVEPFGPV